VMRSDNPPSDVWPDAIALPCPACGKPVRLKGVRTNLRLEFQCPVHGWFEAASWSSDGVDVNPCVVSLWTAPVLAQRAFITGALEVLIRAGTEGDAVYFHAPDPDHSVRFTLVPGGDGNVLAEVGARLWLCTWCGKPPPAKPEEEILFELGFAPATMEVDYRLDQLPIDASRLATITEHVFREALGEPADFAICAEFDEPLLAEAFYFGWSLGGQS
jgi:hypothetical protein